MTQHFPILPYWKIGCDVWRISAVVLTRLNLLKFKPLIPMPWRACAWQAPDEGGGYFES